MDVRGPLDTTETGSSDTLRRECNRQRRHPDLSFAPSIKMSLKQVFEKASTTCPLLASYITTQPLCVCVCVAVCARARALMNVAHKSQLVQLPQAANRTHHRC